jgi:hypothetical protein
MTNPTLQETETWQSVAGAKNYEVSNLGRVRSLPHITSSRFGTKVSPGNMLKGDTGPRGYVRVQLSLGDNTKRYLVHRLVATAFIPNPVNKPCVNHIDNNPTNNVVTNLEWVTHKENTAHAKSQNRLGVKVHYQTTKTHCKYGHPLSGDNLTVNPKGHRVCHACTLRRDRKSRAKRKDTFLGGGNG